jgi:hypothetical protein
MKDFLQKLGCIILILLFAKRGEEGVIWHNGHKWLWFTYPTHFKTWNQKVTLNLAYGPLSKKVLAHVVKGTMGEEFL